MRTDRVAAGMTLAYAAGFGLSTIPVAVHLRNTGRLPSFFGLFDMYGGPWFDTLPPEEFTGRLLAFLGVTAAAGATGVVLLRRPRAGGAANLALLPVEAVFWQGFALPIPWALGAARVALVLGSWRRLAQDRHAGTTS